MVWAAVAKLISSLLGGGLTGILANWLNNKKALKELELQLRHQEKMLDKQVELAKLEFESAERRLITESEAAIDVAEARAKKTAFKTDAAPEAVYKLIDRLLGGGSVSVFIGNICIVMLVFVEVLRKFIRPAVTMGLVIGGAVLVVRFLELMQTSGQLSAIFATKGGELFEFVIYTVAYLVGVCLGYWFCERNRIPPPVKRSG